ncbi:MAG: hypothetical protein QOD82_3856, partial [Pseudonocardiales bacterium]|nr:hypothetical protein [Pseudonocardiales bacterium]
MTDYDPTSPHETLPARPFSASVTVAEQAHRPRVRRFIVAAALMCTVVGLSAGCATSPS